jgi:hypothetical protein
MPNSYNVKNLASRLGRATPSYHHAYYFFNKSNNKIPAFITTPNLYYMNISSRMSNQNVKQRLINLTGGPPYGESRARRMVTNALQERQRRYTKELNTIRRLQERGLPTPEPVYTASGHVGQIRFYERLQRALGQGPITNNRKTMNNNTRINKKLESLIRIRMANTKKIKNPSRYRQIKEKQNLLLNHINASKKLSNALRVHPSNWRLRNNQWLINTVANPATNNSLRSVIKRFLETRQRL